MAKSAINDDFKAQHPDWVQAAVNNNYTQLTLDIKKEIKRKQDAVIARREKNAQR